MTTGTGTAVVAVVDVLEPTAFQSGNGTLVHAGSNAKVANTLSVATSLAVFTASVVKLRKGLPVFNVVRVWVVIIFAPF